MVIGVSLVPTIANESTAADDNGNVTGASSALVKLLPLIFVVILIVTAIGATRLKGM